MARLTHPAYGDPYRRLRALVEHALIEAIPVLTTEDLERLAAMLLAASRLRSITDPTWAELAERRLAAKWPATGLTDDDVADLEAEYRAAQERSPSDS
jgi:hypothetical protein